ncbi:MAG: LON peptidase substrate-binding domain-containing protein, partial [Clostridia bacterium]
MLKVEKIENKTISAIALRGIVLFPGITTNFEVARRASIKALKDSEDTESEIFLVAQRDPSVIEPTLNDLYKVGIVARIINSERLTNGNYQLMAEGIARAELDDLHNEDGILKADITIKKVAFDEDFALAKSKMNDCVTVIEYYLKFFSKPSEE